MPSAAKSRIVSPTPLPLLRVAGAATEVVGGDVHCTLSTTSNRRMKLAFTPEFAAETGKDLVRGSKAVRGASRLLKPARRVA